MYIMIYMIGNYYNQKKRMNIRLFKEKRRKRPDVEDMVWAIKMLMMSNKEIKRMITNFRDAVLKYNNQEIKKDSLKK